MLSYDSSLLTLVCVPPSAAALVSVGFVSVGCGFASHDIVFRVVAVVVVAVVSVASVEPAVSVATWAIAPRTALFKSAAAVVDWGAIGAGVWPMIAWRGTILGYCNAHDM